MLLNQDPVTLYGPNGGSKSIPAVDAPGWLAAGWTLEESREAGGQGAEENNSPVSSPQSPIPNPSRQRKKPLAAIPEDDGDGNTLPES
ncbi:hypothetical protein NSTC745_06415 [Nostoc sp. DSM 114161]|jgi:hypothetical protein|uniref:hypothetical protein n=1 Tax=Nostoc sp. DSM 114161 TaxID=3440143 RepID=UPI004045822B